MSAIRARRRPLASDRANHLTLAGRPQGGRALTPPQLAERWAVSPEKVIALIRRGELRAFDVALRPSRRARWRIARADVEAFERRREAMPTPKAPRRRPGPRGDPSYVEYY
jgi:hypothetical protein